MKFLLLCLFLLLCTTLPAQSPEEKLQQYTNLFPQEKVVLLFSKPRYIAGETIHFKAHVLSGNEPSSLSTNLYTELYDKEKKRLDSGLLFLTNGSGDGSFVLPASLAEDVYYIRAYTKWMQNFEQKEYLKAVQVHNPFSANRLQAKTVQWTAKAFVEGGSLVNGAVANVAVRLFSNGSLPSTWSGRLVEKESGSMVTDVEVHNNEIGQVRFLAFAGKTYSLLLRDDRGTTQSVDLPPVLEQGIALQASVLSNKLRYSLLFKNIPGAGNGYKLVASMNNQPVFSATISRSVGEISSVFDIAALPSGLLTLTLFDVDGKPVAERLCFLHHSALQPSVIPVQFDTLTFMARGRNHWRLTVDTAYPASYTVQVTDAAMDATDNFLSDVYLAGDLTSTVQRANWLFQEINPQKTVALDALLITERYRGLSWNEVLKNGHQPPKHLPEQFLAFSGLAKRGDKPAPLRDLNLILRGADSSFSFLQVKTDSLGRFQLPEFYFTDTLNVYAQPNKQKLLEKEVEISFFPLNTHLPFTGVLPLATVETVPRTKNDTLPSDVKRAMAQRTNERLLAEKTKLLEAILITTTTRTPTQLLEEQLVTGLFRSGDAQVFDFVNSNQTSAIPYNNIIEWLMGRVPGLTLAMEDNVPVPLIRNMPAQVFLDEMSVDASTVSTVSPYDVAMIKVYRGMFAGASGGRSSIAIYTRRGNMTTRYTASSNRLHTLTGYRKPVLPVMPDYLYDKISDVADERLLLYRNTQVQPDPTTQKVNLVFYNNDLTKQYRLTVTGFTSSGQPVYMQRIIH